MTERHIDLSSLTPTHTVHRRARIKVQTKSGVGFAWATVETDEFNVALLPRELEPHKESRMRLFLAMAAFSVYYGRHLHTADYEADTLIYAFPNPQDKTVTKIRKQKVR